MKTILATLSFIGPWRAGDRWAYQDKIIKWAFLILVFLLPLAISPWNASRYDLPKLILMRLSTLLLLSLWMIKILRGAFRPLSPPSRPYGLQRMDSPLNLPIALFLLVAAVSTATSAHLTVSLQGRFNAYQGFFTLLNYALLYWLALNLVSAEWIDALKAILTSSVIVVSLYAILQRLHFDPLTYRLIPFDPSRSWSTLGNPLLLGGYLTLVIPVMVTSLWVRAKSKTQEYINIGALVLACISLALTSTRSAWLGVGGSFIFAAIFVHRQSGYVSIAAVKKRRSLLTLFFSLLLGFLILNLWGILQVSALLQRILSVFEPQLQGGRLTLWRKVLPLLLHRPFLGSGPDTFHIISPLGGGGGTHNEFLNIAVTLGFLGLLAFLSLVFTLFLAGIRSLISAENRNMLKSPDAAGPSMFLLGCLSGCFGYLIYLFFNFSSLALSAYFWLFMATILALSKEWEKPHPVHIDKGLPASRNRRRWQVGVTILPLLFLSFFVIVHTLQLTKADVHLARSRGLQRQGNLDQALIEVQRAAALNAKEELHFLTLGRILLAKAIESPPYEGYYSQGAIRAYKSALALNPSSSEARTNLGILYTRFGLVGEAIREWEKVSRFDPDLVEPYWFLAQTYEKMGKTQAAVAAYRKVLTLEPKNVEARKALENLK